ncbi:MAG: DUF5702 domain-containing protein [Oscillospiraceae bacterium]|nr:DUF5702 domain-containing protein [Oscillospiraceae bacterium]
MTKNRRKKFLQCQRASVSIMLSLLTLPVYTFAGTVADLSRISAGRQKICGAGELAMNSALASYDDVLKSVYGLFAVSGDPQELSDNLEAYFEQNIGGTYLASRSDEDTRNYINSIRSMFSDPENISFDNLVKLQNESFRLSGVDNAVLANTAVLENQITEYMKYRGPVSIGRGILSKISAYRNISGQSKVVDAKIEYSKSQSDIQDKLEGIYKSISDYNGICEDIKPEECIEELKTCCREITLKAVSQQSDDDQQRISDLQQKLDNVRSRLSGTEEMCETAIKYLEDASRTLSSETNDLLSCIEELESKGENWSQSIDKLESDELRDAMRSDFESSVGCADKKSIRRLKESLDAKASELSDIEDKLKNVSFCGEKLIDSQSDVLHYTELIKHSCAADGSGTSDADKLADTLTEEGTMPAVPGKVTSDEEFYGYLCRVCSQDKAQSQENSQAQNIRDKIRSFADTSKISGADLSEAAGTSLSDNIPDELLDGILNYSGGEEESCELSQDNSPTENDDEMLENQQNMLSSSADFLSGMGDLIKNITGEGVRNLYFAEYASEMFSCYTSDRKSDGVKSEKISPTTLSGIALSPENNVLYKSEAEYILWGNEDMQKNHQYTNALIFGTRFVTNTMYAYTDAQIKAFTLSSAAAIAGWTGFGIPVVQNVLILSLALAESVYDVNVLLDGGTVPVYKTSTTWVMKPTGIVNCVRNNSSAIVSAAVSKTGEAVDDVFTKIDILSSDKIDELTGCVTGYIDTVSKEASQAAVNAVIAPLQDVVYSVLNSADGTVTKDKIDTMITDKLVSLRGDESDIYSQAKNYVLDLTQENMSVITDAIYDKYTQVLQSGTAKADAAFEEATGKINSIFESMSSKINSRIAGYSETLKQKASDGISRAGSKAKEYACDTVEKYTTGLTAKVSQKFEGEALSDAKSVKTAKGNMLSISYKEYLKIFMMLAAMSPEKKDAMLSRTAVLIQINMTNGMNNVCCDGRVLEKPEAFDITSAYTMVEVNASAKIHTWFASAIVPDVSCNDNGSVKYRFDPSMIGSDDREIIYNDIMSY